MVGQSRERIEVIRALGELPLIIGDQAGKIVVAQKDLLEAAAGVAVEPVVAGQVGEQALVIGDGRRPPAEAGLEICHRDPEQRLLEPFVRVLRQSLIAGQRWLELPVLGEGRRDPLAHAHVVGELLLQAPPDCERLLGPPAALMEAAQRLVDFQQVVSARRPSSDRAFHGKGGFRRLADQQERLPQEVGRQRVGRPDPLSLSKGRHCRRIPAALGFQQAHDHRRRAVGAGALHPLAIVPDQPVEPSALDVYAVHAVEHRPAPRVLFKRRQELCDQAPFGFVVCCRGRGPVGLTDSLLEWPGRD